MEYKDIDFSTLSNTPDGAAYMRRYLHPPGPEAENIEGFPNGDVPRSLVIDHKDELVIGPGSATPAGAQWDAVVIYPSNPACHTAYITWPTEQGPIAQKINTGQHEFADRPLATEVAMRRDVASSVTCDLVSDSMTNRGEVYAGACAPLPEVQVQSNDMRRRYDTDVDLKKISDFIAGTGLYTKRPAREGDYMPIQRRAIIGEFVSAKDLPHDLEKDRIVYYIGTGEEYFLAGAHTDPEWQIAVQYWRGLDHKSQLVVKRVMVSEYIVRPLGKLRSFASLGAQFDRNAITNAQALRRAKPISYPAKDNFLGGILNFAKNALFGIGRFLLQQLAPNTNTIIDKAAEKAATFAKTAVARAARPPPPSRPPPPLPPQNQNQAKRKANGEHPNAPPKKKRKRK